MSQERPVRLRDAMPAPLLVVFVLVALVALVASLIVILRPPFSGEPALAERRPPPAGPYAHDPVEVFQAPIPDEPIAFEPPCAAMRTASPVGGVSFVRRVTDALASLCTLQGPSISADARRAVARGFRGTEIRIAQFGRSGIESTVDLDARAIFVNLPLTRRTIPVAHLVPVLLHEAWHLAGGEATARGELTARAVELEACRQFIRRSDWPRSCRDADALLALARERALDELVSVGYERGVSSGA